LNVHAPSDKSYDLKDSFYEEIEQVFCNFPKYHTEILLGDVYAKLQRVYFQTNNRELQSTSG
jgi:hypothetical protein